ncbi:MAG: hypothetical protein B7Y45_10165 [Sphingomonas sp. 28-66-16]|nr:MAG: hypothetical protein B7Y45_10165 [Sphingomonas sp. 28-66-16]
MLDDVAELLGAADEDGPDTPEERERKAWHRRITIGAAGFFLAVMLAAINAISAIRGSVIVVQPPEQVILYRDGDDDKAVLTMAMRLAMINAAGAEHGDVLMEATITPMKGGPAFKFAGSVKPVFTNDPDAASKCEIGARCVTLPGLLAIEQGDDIIDIPGGSVRSPYLAYPVTDWNCEGDAKQCGRFTNFDHAIAAIARGEGEFTVNVNFYSDGKRRIICQGRAIDLAYLRKTGWMTIGCKQTKITGAPVF